MNPVTLAELYRTIPAIQCRGLCQASCGAFAVGESERRRMEAAGGPFTVNPQTLTCGYLRDGRCAVYADRPLVCRVYGVEETLRCPHGCEPARELSAVEGRQAVQRLERIAGRWVWPTYEQDGKTFTYRPRMR